MITLDAINALTPILTDVLCVAGVSLAARRNLARKIAVTSLLPPDKDDNLPPPPPPVTPVKGWRKLFTKAAFKAYATFICMFGFQMAIAILLPRLNSALVLNLFHGSIITALLFFCTGYSSTLVVPDSTAVSLERKKPDSPLSTKTHELDAHHKLINHTRTAFAALTTVTVLYSAYNGINLPALVLPVGWTMMMIASTQYPKVTVKKMAGFLVGIIIAAPVLGAVISGVIWLFGGDPSKPANDPAKTARPAVWLLDIMLSLSSGMACVTAGTLVALTLRFEHAQAYASSPRLLSTEPVPVPRSLPPFSAPLFRTGLHVLLAALLAMDFAPFTFWPSFTPDKRTCMGVLITIPVVVFGMAAKAWSLGNLKEWLEFAEESWVPNEERAKEIREMHAEMGDGAREKMAEGEEEKRVEEEQEVETRL